MRAVVHDTYGPPDVLRIEEVPRPEPGESSVVVRVHATTVSRSDTALRAAHPWPSRFVTGLRRPRNRITGSDYAGVVEAVGPAVTEFAPGDRVFGATGGWRAHAEYVSVREDTAIVHIPDRVTFEQAAAASDGPILTMNTLRPVDVKGKRLLVYGASGSMGTAGVQLGKHFGAHVTAVTDTKHLELARELGADAVIDRLREDFTRSGETWDVIFDAVGKLRFLRVRRALAPGGAYLPTDGFTNFFLALPTKWLGDRRVRINLPPRYRKDDLLVVKRLLEEGRYTPVVDRTYPLEDVAEASRYVETGQKTGNVVLTVA